MRISDWSSDVCSSDLGLAILRRIAGLGGRRHHYPPVPALLASQPGQVGGIERSAKAALPVREADADPGRRIRCLGRGELRIQRFGEAALGDQRALLNAYGTAPL